MKKMKSAIALFLAIIMIFACTACAAKEEPATAEEEAATESAAPAETAEPSTEPDEDSTEAASDSLAPEFTTDTYKLNICTATSSGIFYAGGTALAQLWQEELSGYFASATSSSGSGENVTLLANGEANVAFIQSDYVLNAYQGLGDFEGQPNEDFRILCPMFSNNYNLMITEKSGITSLKDVKGKRVVAGRAGSGTLSATEAILSTFDITMDDVVPSYLDQAQSVESLRNGLADFALAAGAIPMAAVTDAMTGNSNIRLLSLPQEEIDQILEKHSWLSQMDIPANTYDNQPEEVKTVGHNSYLVVKADMPDDVAYRLVMTMYENYDWLVNTLNTFNNPCFNEPSGPLSNIGVPLHPGAELALKELGLY